MSFLANPKLLCSFVQLTFGKTNPYDAFAVFRTMDITSKWLLKLHSKGMAIPPDFCWDFFIRGIEMLLQLDHGTSTAKVIWLLYQVLHAVPLNIRNTLLGQILKPDVFFGFFFNWSRNVRNSFYYLFYFQLHRIFIDNKQHADDLQQSLLSNIDQLGLSKVDQGPSEDKLAKMNIPLHENLPKADYEKKAEPVPFAEIKIFQA